jgi:hypothetical protein
VRHGLGRHQELQLVDAGLLVDGDAPQSGIGIARDQHAAVDQRLRVDLIPQRGRDLS